MIIATKFADASLRGAFPGEDVSIKIGFAKLLEQLALDPNTLSPKRDCYIVTSDDITSARDKARFEEAAASKHPDTKIIFVNKGNRNVYPDGCVGVDIVLEKASKDQIRDAISGIVSHDLDHVEKKVIGRAPVDKISKKEVSGFKLSRARAQRAENNNGEVATTSVNGMPILVVEGTHILITQAVDEDGTPTDPPVFYSVNNLGEYNPVYPDGSPIEVDEYGNILDPHIVLDDDGEIVLDEDGFVMIQEIPEDIINDTLGSNANNLSLYDTNSENPTTPEGNGLFFDDPTHVVGETMDLKSNLKSMLDDASKMSDLTRLVREMNASAVIKDLVQTNSTYAGIEEKLASLKDAIYVILADRSYVTAEERFAKIHAIMHDRVFYNATGNTLIEQLTCEIVDIIVSKASAIINDRLDELNKAIRRTAEAGITQDTEARLAGLGDERASIIAELFGVQTDLKTLLYDTDSFITSVNNKIATSCDEVTDMDDINMQLKARGLTITDSATMQAVAQLITVSTLVPEKYRELEVKVAAERELIQKLLKTEEEILDAQKLVVEQMRKKGLEGKIVVQGVLKKTLNIFVGADNVGKTIIPYLYAKYKSKQNCHVLLLNICKNDKFKNYNINTIPYDDFVTNMILQDFTVVKASIADEVASAQQFITALLKAADWYNYIYVVMDDDQTNLFNVISPDVYSVNYIVDTNPDRLDAMRLFIDSSKRDNVAERIFINRCNVSLRSILARLNKLDSIDYRICVTPEIPEITDGCLSGFDPFGISAVSVAFEEIHRYAES